MHLNNITKYLKRTFKYSVRNVGLLDIYRHATMYLVKYLFSLHVAWDLRIRFSQKSY